MIVPVVNVIAFLVFAFEDWPIGKRSHDDTKCSSCGSTIADDWIVCPYCQERLRGDCPQCGKIIQAVWKSCPFCATPIHNTDDIPLVQMPPPNYPCPQCRKPVAYDAKRCTNCGEALFEIMGYYCTRCGSDVEDEWTVCPRCGEPLGEEE